MTRPDVAHVHPSDDCPICPGCGESDYEDNRIDERPYAEAAEDAHWLRHEGRDEEVIDRLSALYAIRIINFVRRQWQCRVCGVRFDGGADHVTIH